MHVDAAGFTHLKALVGEQVSDLVLGVRHDAALGELEVHLVGLRWWMRWWVRVGVGVGVLVGFGCSWGRPLVFFLVRGWRLSVRGLGLA